jgi:hypothetical protein
MLSPMVEATMHDDFDKCRSLSDFERIRFQNQFVSFRPLASSTRLNKVRPRNLCLLPCKRALSE